MVKKTTPHIPLDAEIDVFASKGSIIKKKTMTYSDYLNMNRARGWKYDAYEKGFCSIKETE